MSQTARCQALSLRVGKREKKKKKNGRTHAHTQRENHMCVRCGSSSCLAPTAAEKRTREGPRAQRRRFLQPAAPRPARRRAWPLQTAAWRRKAPRRQHKGGPGVAPAEGGAAQEKGVCACVCVCVWKKRRWRSARGRERGGGEESARGEREKRPLKEEKKKKTANSGKETPTILAGRGCAMVPPICGWTHVASPTEHQSPCLRVGTALVRPLPPSSGDEGRKGSNVARRGKRRENSKRTKANFPLLPFFLPSAAKPPPSDPLFSFD